MHIKLENTLTINHHFLNGGNLVTTFSRNAWHFFTAVSALALKGGCLRYAKSSESEDYVTEAGNKRAGAY